MKEINHQRLEEALHRLPEYAAPERLWEKLDATLEAEQLVQQQLPYLPEYEPPADVWPQLESDLNEEQTESRVRRVFPLRPFLIAAASVSLILTAWWVIQEQGYLTKASISYSQEVIDESLLISATAPEDDAFQLLDELCQERLPVCEDPAFRQMKAELEELTAAKTALHEAMGRYTTDPELHTELARIERERSEILRSMMSMI